MSEQLASPQPFCTADVDKEVHLIDLLIVLARHKRTVIVAPIATGIVAFAASFLITPTFTSTAKILPPQQQQSSGVAAMLGQIGGLAGAAGGLAGLKSPNDLFIGLLESRTIADHLVTRFKLKERYAQPTLDETRKKLAANTVIAEAKKGGFITIATDDKDPQFAADLANAYFEELAQLNQAMALTEASQRRVFFEKQLKEAGNNLAGAEVALRHTQEKTGIIRPDAQVQAIITNLAQLKGAIAAKEVELSSLRTFAAVQNPERLRSQEELRSLQAQVAKLEKNQPSKEGDFMVPVERIPEVGVEYVRSARSVKYYETIFELLAKQFELAKIDEAKDSPSIQLLDKALPAEKKSKPSRALITIVGAFAGLILGIFWSLMKSAFNDSLNDPKSRNRWLQFSLAWNHVPIVDKR